MSDPAPIAIISAMSSELVPIERQLTNIREESIVSHNVVTGLLHETPLVMTGMAGIGKVRAAIALTILIERFRPQLVIFCGVAGSLNPTLKPGDVVVSTAIGYHDFGVLGPGARVDVWRSWNPATGDHNPLMMEPPPTVLGLARQVASDMPLTTVAMPTGEYVPSVMLGKILTGDLVIVAPSKVHELREEFGADAIEMEGAVTAEVCLQRDLPWLVVRGISDTAGSETYREFERYGEVAMANAAAFTQAFVMAWWNRVAG